MVGVPQPDLPRLLHLSGLLALLFRPLERVGGGGLGRPLLVGLCRLRVERLEVEVAPLGRVSRILCHAASVLPSQLARHALENPSGEE